MAVSVYMRVAGVPRLLGAPMVRIGGVATAVDAIRVNGEPVTPEPPPVDPDAFLLNTTRPGPENAGVPVGATLTLLNKSMITLGSWSTDGNGIERFNPKAGATISQMLIPWPVVITVANVTLDKCEVTGPQTITGGNSTNKAQNPEMGLIICQGTNTLITQCTIRPTVPFSGSTGIIGRKYKAHRCRVEDVTDYFGVYDTRGSAYRADVEITGCYGTRMGYYSPDPYQSDNMTHNDGIQWQGNLGLKVHGNYFHQVWSPRCHTPSDVTEKDSAGLWVCNGARGGGRGITGTPNVAPIGEADIQYNWIFGGITFALVIPKTGVQTSSTGIGIFNNNRDLGHHRVVTSSQRGIAYNPAMPWNSDWPTNQASGYSFLDTADAGATPPRVSHGNLFYSDSGTTSPARIWVQAS